MSFVLNYRARQSYIKWCEKLGRDHDCIDQLCMYVCMNSMYVHTYILLNRIRNKNNFLKVAKSPYLRQNKP